MKYFLVAGENSGDLHGANLMECLKKNDVAAEFKFCGGDLMLQKNKNLSIHCKNMSFMGFVEVLMNLKTIRSNFKVVQKDILEFRPDALILIDYPGFNLRLARYAKDKGLKVFYYISPKVWAWKSSRIKKLKAYVDHLLVILPFEKEFFRRHDYQVEYVGNPLMDQISDFQQNAVYIEKSEEKVLALLPGSRTMEVKRILPIMVVAAKQFKDIKVVVSGVSSVPKELYSCAEKAGFAIEWDNSYKILARAHFAAVTSGTATLEAGLFKVPQVVCYRANSISIWLAKKLVKIKYISLVNLILDKNAVTELIQEDFQANRLFNELQLLNEGESRAAQLQDYEQLRKLVGEAGASERAAQFIIQHSV